MKKAFYILLAVSLIAGSAQAQRKDSISKLQKPHYFFSFSNGMLIGKDARSITYTLNTVHGISFRRLKIGVGIGLDTYTSLQTLPLFGQVTYDILDFKGSKNSIYVQGSYGWSHAWRTGQESGFYSLSDSGGKMITAMLGYRLDAGKVNLYFGAGYKFQSTASRYDYFPVYSQPDDLRFAPSGGYSQKTVGEFERLVITLGVGLK